MIYKYRDCSNLTSVSIPNSVTSIGEYAFYGCGGLTSVTIGSGVQTIENDAFAGCSQLTDVYCYAEKVPSAYSGIFKDSYIKYATLHVPTASIDAYKTTEPWSGFGTIVALDAVEEPEICTVNGVEYAIKSSNLIQNGTFDDGFSHWTGADNFTTEITSYAFSILTEEGHENYLVGTINAGKDSPYSLGTAWNIEPNKTYYFAYDVKYLGDKDGEPLYIKSTLTNTKGVETEELGLPTLKAGEWTTFEKVFTNTNEYAYCQVKFRWLAGMYGFDNFKLYEVTQLTSELEAAKKDAIAALDELPVGENIFQYSANDIAKAKASIEAAKSIQAVKAVGLPSPNLPEANTGYIFSLKTSDENSPYELSATEDGIKIVNAGQGTPLYLASQGDGTWSISNSGKYLNYGGGSRSNLALTDIPLGWTFRVVEGGYTIMGVYNGVNGYIGTNKLDGETVNSPCYGNKSWSDGNVIWTITKFAGVEPNAINAPMEMIDERSYEIYTLDGRLVKTLQKGVNIIRMEDGKTKKVLVR